MKKPRSNPELEVRLVEAHARGAPIEDLEYDEVTNLLDIALERARKTTAEGTAKIREVAKELTSRTSGTGLKRVGT